MWIQMAPKGEYDLDKYLVWYSPPRNGSSLLLRRSVFDDAGVFNTQLGGSVDMEMWLRILRDAKSPNFYGTKEFMVDYRRRESSMTGNLLKSLNIVDTLLTEWAPQMRHLPPGAAYVRPALVALGKGSPELSDLTEKWVREASSTGVHYLIRDVGGRRFLGWKLLGARGRLAARRLRAVGFNAVLWAANRAMGLRARLL